MTDFKDLTPPTKSAKDYAHSIFKGALATIPSVIFPAVPGLSLLGEVFDFFFVPPIQKRIESWMEMIAKELDELRNSGFVRWEDLKGDERFDTVLIQCTQAAMRQHQKEKLTLLLNALSNTAQQKLIEEDLESTFIRHIDELTVTHFYLLTFLYENEKNLANIQDYDGLLKIFNQNREVQIGSEEFRLFCKDLESRLLVRFSRYMGEPHGVWGPPAILTEGEDLPMLKVTELGLKLLSFVKDHKKNDEK